jgi:hypothetical protein
MLKIDNMCALHHNQWINRHFVTYPSHVLFSIWRVVREDAAVLA